MADGVNLEFLGAHINRLRTDMNEVQTALDRLSAEGNAVVGSVTELTLKLAQVERALGDLRSYVDLRAVELLKYGLGAFKEELVAAARPRQSGS